MGGVEGMPVSCYLWIPPQAQAAAVGTVPVGLSAFILGDGRGGEINKKKANSRDRRILAWGLGANEEF